MIVVSDALDRLFEGLPERLTVDQLAHVLGLLIRAGGPPVVASGAAKQVGQHGFPGPTVDTEPEHVVGVGEEPSQPPLVLGEPGDTWLGT